MHSSYKKRKEKKLNMQGKGNMVLSYFIINIHMQLRRGEAGHNSFNPKAYTYSREERILGELNNTESTQAQGNF